MRKALLTVVLALAMAGLATAGPVTTAGGGTIYFTFYDSTQGKQLYLKYMNLGTDWKPVNASGSTFQDLGTLTSPADGVAQTSPYNIRLGYDSTTGFQDMNNSYNSGSIVLCIRYDNSEDALSPNGTQTANKGMDIIVVKQTAATGYTVTTINGGWTNTVNYVGDVSTKTTANAYSSVGFAVTDSSYLGSGTASGTQWGYVIQGPYTRTVWSADAAETHLVVPNQISPSGSFGSSFQYAGKLSYDTDHLSYVGAVDSNYKPTGTNDKVVTGVVVTWGQPDVVSTGATPNAANFYNQLKGKGFIATYKLQNEDTYRKVIMMESDSYWPECFTAYSSGQVRTMTADTDLDGIADVYFDSSNSTYHGSTFSGSGHALIHCEDVNGDGDWIDNGEQHPMFGGGSTAFGLGGLLMGTPFLTQTPSGKYVILKVEGQYATVALGAGRVQIDAYGLDEYGDWDGTDTLIASCSQNSLGVVFGDSSLLYLAKSYQSSMPVNQAGNFDAMLFDPLLAYGDIPEPTTMMLLGTGVLGLAGVLRRRLLS